MEYASRSRKYFNDMCIHIAYVFLKHRYKFQCSRRDMKILINHEITFNFRDYTQHSVLIILFFIYETRIIAMNETFDDLYDRYLRNYFTINAMVTVSLMSNSKRSYCIYNTSNVFIKAIKMRYPVIWIIL